MALAGAASADCMLALVWNAAIEVGAVNARLIATAPCGVGVPAADYGYRTRRLYAYAPTYDVGYMAGPYYNYAPGYNVAVTTDPYYTSGWNVAYAGPYYSYAPSVSFGIGIGPVGTGFGIGPVGTGFGPAAW